MNGVEISCKHLELTGALSEHVHAKMGKVLKHLDAPPTSCAVVLSVERNRHTCEVKMHAHQRDFFSKSEEADMYAAIDSAVDKVGRQVGDFKQKANSHRN